jgi:hypothetical protein
MGHASGVLLKCGKVGNWCSIDLNRSNVWFNVVEVNFAFHCLTLMVFVIGWQRWLND